MKLVSSMDESDQGALLTRLDQYQKDGIPAERAQVMAASDTLAELEAERKEFMAMMREQHPDLFLIKLEAPKLSRQRDVTDAPEFKAWSKGLPVYEAFDDRASDRGVFKLYHATTADFNEFKPGGLNPSDSGPAIWLSADPSATSAAFHVGNEERGFRTGAQVMPVYARVARPMVIDDKATLDWAREAFAGGSREFPQLISRDVVDAIKNDGYDSIIFDGKGVGWKDAPTEVIVLDPTQVKSAIGNNGQFDTTNPNITKSAQRKSIEDGASAIASMDPDVRDNTEIGDFPGGPAAYNLYEARKLLKKPSDKLKRVTENNSFSLWQDYDYVANVDGEHFGVTKQEDPDEVDDENKFVFSFENLKDGRNSGKDTVTDQVDELFKEMRASIGGVKRSAQRNSIGFYSALAKGIEDLPTKQAPAGAWKAAIKGLVNKGAAKQDEVTWSGIEDFLDLQDGKVSKEQIAEYLAGNGVQVDEVTLGNSDKYAVREAGSKKTMYFDSEDEAKSYIENGVSEYLKDWHDSSWTDDDISTAEQQARDRFIMYEPGEWQDSAKYQQYTLPGGENYREVLLTLPSTPNSRLLDLHRKVNAGERLTDSEVSEYRNLSDKEDSNPTKTYSSRHWEQPNVVAHIRVDDRTDADGNKVLFVEEVQSDWGQEGKKNGFQQESGPAEKAYREYEAGLNARFESMLRDELGSEIKDPARLDRVVKNHMDKADAGARAIVLQEKPTLNEYARAWNDELRKNAEKTPVAPFVTKTDGWLNLALKRIVTMAVDGGYDKVAFVNGEQSADRYDLSKQVDQIRYIKNADGTFDVWAADKMGASLNSSVDKQDLTPDQIEEFVGKDVAKKIVAGEGRSKDGDMVLEGIDLKVGGEGMKSFYDSIVPNAVKALLKKVGGGQLQDVVFRKSRGFEDSYMQKNGMAAQPISQPGFEITDAIREKASQGLPLFSRQRDGDNFKTWSGGAPLVELGQKHAFKSGQPVVVEALHGTTNADLTEFKRERANIESDFGAGFYASNTPEDVAANYANDAGADLTQKVELLAERIEQEDEFEGDHGEALRRARAQLSDSAPNTMKLYMRFSNPAVLGGKGETFFDYEEKYNEELDQHDEPTGKLVDFVDSLRNVASDFIDADADQAMAAVWEDVNDNEGIKLSDLVEKLKSSDGIAYATDEEGNNASSEVIRRALEDMGFDGIIDTTVVSKFGPRMIKGAYTMVKTEGMSGMTKDTAHFIAFQPKQIKSATGNNGDFSLEKRDITKSNERTTGDYGRQYTPQQLMMFKNTGRTTAKPTLIERLKEARKDIGKKMAQGLVDQFRPLRDLGGQAYTLARLSKGAAGAFEALLQHGKLSIKDGAYDADMSGGFIDAVGKPLGAELEDFMWWVAANRADSLKAEDRENLFTDDDIAAGKSLASGQMSRDYTLANGQVTRDRALAYQDAQKKFDAFNKNVLDIAEQSGLIDGESRQFWEGEFYVPFYRVSEDDGEFVGPKIKGGLARQRAFHELKGGSQKLNSDLLANAMKNWAHLIDASAKNRAAKATLESSVSVGIALEADEETVRQLGKSISGKGGTVWFMDGGQKRHFLVGDPYVLEAINSLEYAGMRGPLMDALSTMKHWLTVGVTASPAFKVRNLIRDSLQAISLSGLSYNPLQNLRDGYMASDKSSQEYVSALASGGLIRFGTMAEGNASDGVRRLVNKGVSPSTILDNEGKLKAFYGKYIEPAVEAYQEIGNRGEEINRAALYTQLRKNGVNHAEAALMARDLLDFNMQGTWSSIRFLTQVVPFMNARAQGLYKLGRAAQEDPRRFAMVTGAVALASVALLAAYGDDDDWKKREDWDRDQFFWFKFGGTAFRIPKPFEIGAIASLAERSVELFTNDKFTGKMFGDRVLHLLSDNLSMNPIPQAVKPIIDVYSNKDAFTGRPIESMGMERLQSEYRYNSSTSMIARGASTAMNAATRATIGTDALSPLQVDSLLRGYFSWLGTFVVAGADMAIRPMTNEPTRPQADYLKVVTQGFLKSLPEDQSKYVSFMYEQAKQLEQAYATHRQLIKDGKVQEARDFAAENKDMLSRYHLIEAVKKRESDINQQVHKIEISNIDPAQKREQISRLRQQASASAEKVY